MDGSATVTFPWADGDYTFRLKIGEIRKLQDRTNAGLFELLQRIVRGTWRVDELRETIRLGLQGGGTCVTASGSIDDTRIRRLIEEHVDERPWLQSAAVAARILEASLYEPQDDPVPKSEAAQEMAPAPKTASSPSPPSTDGVQSSDSVAKKSTRSRSTNSGRRKRAS